MLLFQKRFHEGLVRGDVTLTFRAWSTPKVKAGGRYRCHPIGVLEVDRVLARDVTDDEARRSGFPSRDALLDYLGGMQGGALAPDAALWRVALHYGGDGDRVEGALDDRLSAEEVEAIRARLAKFDAKSPWTAKTLRLIERHPRVAASRLAAQVGRETAPFKADVVRLKKLGLTQSFEVGYEVSPRGRAYLTASAAPRRKSRANGRGAKSKRRRG
jgi:hypothetical protein